MVCHMWVLAVQTWKLYLRPLFCGAMYDNVDRKLSDACLCTVVMHIAWQDSLFLATMYCLTMLLLYSQTNIISSILS